MYVGEGCGCVCVVVVGGQETHGMVWLYRQSHSVGWAGKERAMKKNAEMQQQVPTTTTAVYHTETTGSRLQEEHTAEQTGKGGKC